MVFNIQALPESPSWGSHPSETNYARSVSMKLVSGLDHDYQTPPIELVGCFLAQRHRTDTHQRPGTPTNELTPTQECANVSIS